MKIHTVQLNLEDFDNGTSDLSPLEFGIYTRLFLASYTRELPDDDEKLARIARCKISEIKKARPIIEKKFKKIDGFFFNSRTENEKIKYQKISEKNKINASNRWKIKGEGMPTALPKEQNGNAVAMLPNTYNLIPNNNTPTPTPISENMELKKIGDLVGGVGAKKNWRAIEICENLSGETIENIKNLCRGWDIMNLAQVYVDGINSGKREPPNSISKAFPKWCENYTKKIKF